MKRGFDVLRDKRINRSIAFGRKDRDRLGLTGLLPYRVATDRQMVHRVMVNLERLPRDIDRYMPLSTLQERNERLFYQTVIEHIDRILPLIYTPTVGEACKEFSHIAREPKGFFITPDDHGTIRRIMATGQQGTSASLSSRTDNGFSAWEIRARTEWVSRSESLPSTPRAPDPSRGMPTGHARRRHEQRGTAERCAVSRISAPATDGERVFRSRRRIRDRGPFALSRMR